MTRSPPGSDDENELERSLERALHRQALSAEALRRVRANVFAEFQRQTGSVARRRRIRWSVAIAATVSALAVGAFLMLSRPPAGMPVAQLEIASDGVVLAGGGLLGRHRIDPGATLQAGERWETRAPVLARLSSGGTLRLAAGTVIVAKDAQTLALEKGRVYFDFPRGAGRFLVQTAFGSIEHVGTQFEVMQLDRRVRLRVREGRVILHARNDSVAVDTGMEVLMNPEGRIDRSAYPTYGDDWAWAESIAPPFDIENCRLADFLSWVSREMGRQITFSDARAREIANQTTLHGSVRGLRPMDALNQVLSTTSLRFEVREGEIRISSRN